MRSVILYTRPGCCLCDEVRQVLLELRSGHPDAFALQEQDIESSDELLRLYLERIPVITIDGVEAFELFVSQPELEQRLGIVRTG